MRVRFVVDRVVVENVSWPHAEREGFNEKLREAIRKTLVARAVEGQRRAEALPVARSAGRERVEIAMEPGACA